MLLPYGYTTVQSGKRTRFLFIQRDTRQPSIATSLYESYLSARFSSPNSVRGVLESLAYLYSWSHFLDIDIDSLLLDGEGLSDQQIRQFAFWLSQENTNGQSDAVKKLKPTTINRILYHCEDATRWFRSQFAVLGNTPNSQRLAVDRINRMRHTAWREVRLRSSSLDLAPDLNDKEIRLIEEYLRPLERIKKGVTPNVAHRDYLIWRLAIEFGLRKGEILALRLQDCPCRDRPYLKIVRVEDRGPDYFDARGQHAPRPKTLSRDLGYLLADSPIPSLIGKYRSKYRRMHPTSGAAPIKHPFAIDHDFLFINHQSGSPWSAASMQKLAEVITRDIGVSFHWHLARHAFFNRAYEAVSREKDNQALLTDLVYFGGWRDPSSLNIYSRRAVRDRARTSLRHWQSGDNSWPALN